MTLSPRTLSPRTLGPRSCQMWTAILAGFLLCAGVALATPGVPAQQSSGDRVRLTAFPGALFQLRSGSLGTRLSLKGQLPGCTSGLYDPTSPGSRPSGGEAQTRVIDLVRRGGAWYLLFQATLQGGCNVQGECGAGSDTSLVWLKLSPALRPLARQVEVVELCMSGLSVKQLTGSNDGGPQAFGPLLELQRGRLEVVSVQPNYEQKIDTLITVRYRHAAPEQGLKVSRTQVAQK